MITISNETKTACNSENITYKEYIVIGSDTVEIKGKMSNTAYKDGNFIGTFNLKMLEFTTENDVDYRKKEFVYYKQVNDEAFKIGTYIVTGIKESDTKEEVSITAMDYGLKFAIPYVSELNYEGGSVTLRDVLDEICTITGVTLNNGLITNGGFIVDSNQFVNGELCGDVISYIAGITGDFATTNQDDELEFIFNTTTSEVIEDYVELDDKRDTRPITIVVLGNKDITGQEAVRTWAEGVALYGENYLRINDNLFAYTLEKREALIDAIFNKVKGFGYSAFESKYSFKPYMQLGDLVQFKNKNGDLVNSIILKIDTDYDDITLSAPSIIDASVDYELTQTAYDIAKRAEIIVNQATGDITLLSKRVDGNETYISSIGLTPEEISLSVSKVDELDEDINDPTIGLSKKYGDLSFDVNQLRNEIGDVTDTTTQEEGSGTLLFESINTSEPINITIRPPADKDISYLYPSSGLFPSSSLFPQNRILRFYNSTTDETFDYILPANLRYLNSTTYDELYLDYGTLTCRVTRKVAIAEDMTKSALAVPVEETYTYPTIALTAGDYTVTMLGYPNAYMKIRLMSQNMYTSQFATRVEMSSAITQSANEINLEVAKKVDKTGVISSINLTSEAATINANKIKLEGLTTINNNFKVLLDGSIEANNGLFRGDVKVGNTNLVDKNLGVYTMIEVVREELVGQRHWQQGGGTIFEQRGIELRFYIPPNFTITEAKILLKQYRTRHSNSYPWQTDIDGKLTTVNLYKGTVNRIITITQDFDSVDFGSSSHGTVVSAFGGYTAPNFYENSVMSSDIKAHITSGDNYFYISNGSTFETFETPMQEAQYKALLNARLPKSAFASATLMIYGYIK